MEKPKREVVGTAMRDRLLRNRDGRLYKDQWLSLITEPLTVILLLVVPAAVILGPNFKLFFTLGAWLMIPLLVLAIGIPAFSRARRYARAPLKFAVLYTPRTPRSALLFWKPDTFITKDEREIHFRRRLAPHMRLIPDHPYLVYYAELKDGNVLLSLAPADHPDAGRWRPTRLFEQRQARSAGT